MKKYIILSLVTSAIVIGGSLISVSAIAQEEIPGHPRVNEIDHRIDNQENRINAEEQAGKITPEQAARDEKRLEREKGQLQKNEGEHNGHITKGEDKHLNKELNHDNRHDERQIHEDRVEKRKEKRNDRKEKREERRKEMKEKHHDRMEHNNNEPDDNEHH